MLIGVQAVAQAVPVQPGSEADTAADPARTTQEVRRDERKAALREALKHRREAWSAVQIKNRRCCCHVLSFAYASGIINIVD